MANPSVHSAWYADDSGGAGHISSLLTWWNDLEEGGRYRDAKLAVRKQCSWSSLTCNDLACSIFKDTGIKIITGDVRYSESCIGESVAWLSFMEEKPEIGSVNLYPD